MPAIGNESRPSGQYVEIEAGLRAFVPNFLPIDFPIDMEMVAALSDADRAVGALAGLGLHAANPHLLIPPFLRKEAVASSRIEGTQADLGQLVLFEAMDVEAHPGSDVREVSNYVRALEYGLAYQAEQPVSLWLMRAMHAQLLDGVRGVDLSPGQVRIRQNHIARRGQTIRQARYIPPPPTLIPELLENLEQYIVSPSPHPPLIRLALVHYQFEAIHPFLDGNGRLGRLLISLLLSTWDVLPQPLLYLSAYFEQHREEYMTGLLRVSTDSAWRSWIILVLGAIREQSNDALLTSRRLTALREEYRERYHTGRSAWILLAIDLLFERPVITVSRLARSLNITYPTAMSIVTILERDGVLTETTGNRRNRVYGAMEIFNVLLTDMPEPDQTAGSVAQGQE
ncbi:MAG: Fic family protein [Chloroflexota bacterium]|nr:Fic family protein [Chloroflexota bacterium]